MPTKKTSAKKPFSPKTFKPTLADLRDAADRAQKINRILAKTYPKATCALDHRTPLQLLVATILAAQCTDERVNIVSKDLFKKYRSPADYVAADPAELEDDIRSTGFFRNKTKSIQSACKDICEIHDGKVPSTMKELTALHGVGRKTANVLLGECFDTPGIVTDTHVIRLSRLIGLSRNTDPVKLEHDLMKLVPQPQWTLFSHRLVFHGRSLCLARKPDCPQCPIRDLCAFGRKLPTADTK